MPLPLMAIAAGAGLLGKLFGGAAKGAADERTSKNVYGQNTNQLQNQQYSTQQNAATNLAGLQERATMDRAQMGIAAPQARTKQALLGSLLKNIQTAKVSAPAGVNMGSITGGLTPDAISAATRAGGGELEKQALMALMSGSDVPEATDYQNSGKVAPPTLASYQDPGKMESILSALGLVGGVGGAISEIGNINRGSANGGGPEMSDIQKRALGLGNFAQ